MGALVRFIKGVFVVFCSVTAIFLISAINPMFGMLLCVPLFFMLLFSIFRPLERLWLSSRVAAGVGVFLSFFVFLALASTIESNDKKRLAALRSENPEAYLLEIARTGSKSVVATEAKLVRESNPSFYMTLIKGRVSDEEYLAELKAIDPPGYTAEVARREEEQRQIVLAEKKARSDELASLMEKIKNSSMLSDEENVIIYSRLSILEPNNQNFVRQKDEFSARIELKRQRQEAISHPERFVEIQRMSWRKDGLGTVMMLNLTLKNNAPIDIKDLEIKCAHSAESGTSIDSNARTIYQVVKAKSVRTISEFNMGFIHSQASSTSCKISSAVAVL